MKTQGNTVSIPANILKMIEDTPSLARTTWTATELAIVSKCREKRLTPTQTAAILKVAGFLRTLNAIRDKLTDANSEDKA